MMLKRYFAFCVLLYFFSACSVQEKREVVLHFGVFSGSNWDVAIQDSSVVFNHAIQKFERAHPGVVVSYRSGIRKEHYSEWLSQQVLKGSVPDVFIILDSDFGKMVSLGVLESLDAYIENDSTFDRNRYYRTCIESGQMSDKQYALPFETAADVMCVNKTLLEKEQVTLPPDGYSWQDLYEICKKITKDCSGDGVPDQFGICDFTWLDAVYSDQISLFSIDGRQCYFNTPDVAQAVQFIQKLGSLNYGYKVTREDFENGRVAFMPQSVAEYRTYKSYPYMIKKYTEFQWDAVDMPCTPGGRNSSIVSSLLIGMSSSGKNKPLAWEFLKTLVYDSEIQRMLFTDSAGVSPLKDVTESEQVRLILEKTMNGSSHFIDNRRIGEMIENGYAVYQFPLYADAIQIADSEIVKIYTENRNIEESLRLIQRRIFNYIN